MNTHKVTSIKIPPVDKVHYGLWKSHMLLFLRASNKKYTGVLTKGATTLMNVILAQEEDGTLIPHRTISKETSEYINEENEQFNLDISL